MKKLLRSVINIFTMVAIMFAVSKTTQGKRAIANTFRLIYEKAEAEHTKRIRKYGDNVVMLTSMNSGGTGFYVNYKSKLYILTNAHICKLAIGGMLHVKPEDTLEYDAAVLQVYPMHDLCVVDPVYPHAGFEVSNSVEFGETVFALGHPFLQPLTVTNGEFSGYAITQIIDSYNLTPKQCNKPTYKYYLAKSVNPMYPLFGIYSLCVRELNSFAGTVSISPGNSGSPVVNMKGRVVGVAYAANEYGSRSYTVPLSEVVKFLESLQ